MRKIIGLVLLLLFRVSCYADGYWLELQGSGHVGDTLFIRIRYGGVDEQKNRYLKKGAELDKMKGFVLFVMDGRGKKMSVPIRQNAEYWEGQFVPALSGVYRVLAKDETLPVVERPDSLQNIKPVQYLCGAYRVGDGVAFEGAAQYLDLRVGMGSTDVTVMPFIDGKAVAAGTRLRIFYPDNHDIGIVVNDQGQAVFPLEGKGLYLVRLDWVDERPGVYAGKSYHSIRHRCDYSL